MQKHLLFDLDGTLTDPAEGITKSVAHALRKRGIEVNDLATLNCFIGPPLIDSFMKYYGLDEDDARRAVTDYREYFVPQGMFENTVYDGIPALLADLKAGGYTLIIATSKPEPFAVKILEHFGLAHHFDRICGASLDEKRSTKADVVAYTLAQCGITSAESIMIGDRHHDVDGAHANGLAAIGVLWGYGDRAELAAAGAEFVSARENRHPLGVDNGGAVPYYGRAAGNRCGGHSSKDVARHWTLY